MKLRLCAPKIPTKPKGREMRSMNLKTSVRQILIELFPFSTKLKTLWVVSIKRDSRK
jgi:hypothetical protein